MKSRLIMFLISILCLFFIVSLTRSIYSLWQKGGLVTQREQVRDQLQEKNRELTDELTRVQSQEFIEKQAREKLNLQREGEVVVVLPPDLASPPPRVEASVQLPNWQQWWKLFF